MTPEELKTRELQLTMIAAVAQSWINHDKAQRDKEGLATTPDTHIMCPPRWPSHGMLANWVAALTEAAKDAGDAAAAVQAERERCAGIARKYGNRTVHTDDDMMVAGRIADAIERD